MREMVSHGGWLTRERKKNKKITGGASPPFFYFIFNIALLNRI
jgi:hypothetical protein